MDYLHRSSFPTQSISAQFKGKIYNSCYPKLGRRFFSNALMFQLKFSKNTPISPRSTLQTGLYAGFTIKDNLPPPQHWFILGGQSQNNYYDGFIPFYGLRFIEEAGLYTAVGNLPGNIIFTVSFI